MAYPSDHTFPDDDLFPGEPEAAVIHSVQQVTPNSVVITFVGSDEDMNVLLEAALDETFTASRKFVTQNKNLGYVTEGSNEKQIILDGLYPNLEWYFRINGSDYYAMQLSTPGTMRDTYSVEGPLGTLSVGETAWGTPAATVNLRNVTPKVTLLPAEAGANSGAGQPNRVHVQLPVINDADLVPTLGSEPSYAWLNYRNRVYREINGLIPGRTYRATMVVQGIGANPLLNMYQTGVTNARVQVTEGGKTRYSIGQITTDPKRIDTVGAGGVITFTAATTTTRIFVEPAPSDNAHELGGFAEWEGSWSDVHGDETGATPRLGRPIEAYEIHQVKLEAQLPDYQINDMVEDGSLSSYFDIIMNSVGGAWFIDKNGYTQFRPTLNLSAPKAYFSDTPGDDGRMSYTDIDHGQDTQTVVNDLTVHVHSTGVKALTTDDWASDNKDINRKNAASIKKWGSQSAEVDWALTDNGVNLNDRLNQIMSDMSTSVRQINSITTNAHEDPRKTMEIDVFDRILIEYQGFVQDCIVYNIADSGDGSNVWTRTYEVVRLKVYRVSPTFQEWKDNYLAPNIHTFQDFKDSLGAQTFGGFDRNPRRT